MKKTLSLGLLMAVVLLLSASPVFGGNHGGEQGKGPATHIIVFHAGVDPHAAAQDLNIKHGVKTELIYRRALLGMSGIVPPGKEADVLGHPDVAYIERNQRVTAFPQDVPTGIDRADADVNDTADIDGVDGRVDVDIAIIDTGIDLDHPDLNVFASTNCAKGGPFGGDCKDGGGDDGNGHGTHVAGTVAAIDNGTGVVGMAPGARLWAVRVLDNSGSGWMSWIIGGIDYVTAHAGEIEAANMSLGCECSSVALNTAIANSVAAGVVYAVAAGNSDKDASTFSPADHPDVITVSALADFDGQAGSLASPTCREDQDDTLADFSNWGSLIEVTAPGVCILSTWKDGGYKTISGTSMASPHVAGAVGLLASGANAPQNKADVDAIIQTIIDTGNFDWTDDSGDGVQEPLLNVASGPPPAPNDAPTVSVTSPADGSTFHVGDSIAFSGSASDTEDGDLTASLVWTSDIGGQIGTGGSFSATMTEGSHMITASVTDSGGKTGSASVGVTVVNDAPVVSITSPADAATFDSGATILFEGTASDTEDGDLTASLAWSSSIDGAIGTGGSFSTTLSDGNHTITASVTDSGGTTGSASVSITVGSPPAEATTVSVAAVTYATEGGKTQDKHLLITVALLDDLVNAVSGASVTIDLHRDSSKIASGTGTTGTGGTVTFSLKNAKSGTYTTDVTNVSAAGPVWDGLTPANSFTK